MLYHDQADRRPSAGHSSLHSCWEKCSRRPGVRSTLERRARPQARRAERRTSVRQTIPACLRRTLEIAEAVLRSASTTSGTAIPKRICPRGHSEQGWLRDLTFQWRAQGGITGRCLRRRSRTNRTRARDHPQARLRRVLPHHVRDRPVLPTAETSCAKGVAARPTAPCVFVWASRRSIRFAWTCCSSAS